MNTQKNTEEDRRRNAIRRTLIFDFANHFVECTYIFLQFSRFNFPPIGGNRVKGIMSREGNWYNLNVETMP